MGRVLVAQPAFVQHAQQQGVVDIAFGHSLGSMDGDNHRTLKPRAEHGGTVRRSTPTA